MRFEVPQFIEVEDKIVGPLTLKQFIYLAGGAAVCFLSYKYLPLIFSLVIIPVGAGLSLALAFFKINNKPFIFVMEAAIRYVTGSKLYLWHKEPKLATHKESDNTLTSLYIPKLSNSRLGDLTWNLDVSKTQNQVTEEKVKTGERM